MKQQILALKKYAEKLKKELMALHYALKDKRTPLLGKVILMVTLSYALSPVDLIPDFIPLLGYLDDLILLPLLITLALKIIGPEIMTDARLKAETSDIQLKDNWFVGLVFISIWLVVILKLIQYFYSI